MQVSTCAFGKTLVASRDFAAGQVIIIDTPIFSARWRGRDSYYYLTDAVLADLPRASWLLAEFGGRVVVPRLEPEDVAGRHSYLTGAIARHPGFPVARLLNVVVALNLKVGRAGRRLACGGLLGRCLACRGLPGAARSPHELLGFVLNQCSPPPAFPPRRRCTRRAWWAFTPPSTT